MAQAISKRNEARVRRAVKALEIASYALGDVEAADNEQVYSLCSLLSAAAQDIEERLRQIAKLTA